MMKLSKYVLISAALLSGAACLTACSSDDTVSDVVNPNLSPDGKAVKTEFAINIPRAKNARMSADNTQNNNNFLGMKGIHLIPLTSAVIGDATVASSIGLADIPTQKESSTETLQNGTKIYKDVSVPVGTTHFQFYGHAPQGSGVANLADENNFKLGVTTNNLFTLAHDSKFSAIEFALVGARANEEENSKQSEKLIGALNAVTGVNGWKDSQNEGLKALYTKLCTLKSGSANSIKLALEDLYNALSVFNNGDTKSLVGDIRKAIAYADGNALFTVNQEGTDEKKNYKLTWKEELTYPKNINLPEGSVSLTNSEGTFSYEKTNTVLGGSNPLINADNICFPAALYYAQSTAVKATATGEWPASASDWKGYKWNENGWYEDVKGTSTKIALQDNIQYAVASMALTVKCKNGSLADSKNSNITVPEKGYTLTGVLIGGQPKKVGYDFKPTATQASDLTATVYDSNIEEGVVAKAAADKTNYTLVMPNVMTTPVNEVNFALEFKNTGKAFYGKDGLVPENGTFYILGKLTLKNGSYSSSGTTPTDIFMSDTQTKVNATISTLANAYNTIPDLRATNLSLGLSVDLSWTPGLVFDVEIGQ